MQSRLHIAVAICSLLGAFSTHALSGESSTKAKQQTTAPTETAVKFYVRPIIRSSLHDPGSLHDFQMLGVSPVAKAPGMFEVVVGYRAKNRFGAVVYEEATFVLSLTSDRKQWEVVPVRSR
jgi:hypothetical protein